MLLVERIEQLEQPGLVDLGHAVHHLLEGLVDPDVGGPARPVPGRVGRALDRGDDGVADGAQYRALVVGHRDGHAATSLARDRAAEPYRE